MAFDLVSLNGNFSLSQVNLLTAQPAVHGAGPRAVVVVDAAVTIVVVFVVVVVVLVLVVVLVVLVVLLSGK